MTETASTPRQVLQENTYIMEPDGYGPVRRQDATSTSFTPTTARRSEYANNYCVSYRRLA